MCKPFHKLLTIIVEKVSHMITLRELLILQENPAASIYTGLFKTF